MLSHTLSKFLASKRSVAIPPPPPEQEISRDDYLKEFSQSLQLLSAGNTDLNVSTNHQDDDSVKSDENNVTDGDSSIKNIRDDDNFIKLKIFNLVYSITEKQVRFNINFYHLIPYLTTLTRL